MSSLFRSSLYTQMYPPLCFTMPYTVDKPEPRPSPALLRRVKRLEDMRHGLRAHPDSGIADRQHHVLARLDRNVIARIRSHPVPRSTVSTVKPPAVRHGIARIHHQIHDHLLDLVPDRLSSLPTLTPRPSPSRCLHPSSGRSNLSSPEHDGVQIHNLWLHHLSSAESQQLPDQRGRTLSRVLDLLISARSSGCIAVRCSRQLRISFDDGQQDC